MNGLAIIEIKNLMRKNDNASTEELIAKLKFLASFGHKIRIVRQNSSENSAISMISIDNIEIFNNDLVTVLEITGSGDITKYTPYTEKENE